MKIKDFFSGDKKARIYTIAGIAALVVVLVCAGILAAGQYRLWKAQKEFEKLAEATTLPPETETVTTTTEEESSTEEEPLGYSEEAARLEEKYGIEIPEKYIDFDVF